MCLNLFKIQNVCQFWAKSGVSQKDIHTAFSFLFPSVLLSFYHHLKENLECILPSHLVAFSNGVMQRKNSNFQLQKCGLPIPRYYNYFQWIDLTTTAKAKGD